MTNDDKKPPKNAKIFSCLECDFKCSKKSDYERHLTTRKHKMMTNDDKKPPKNTTRFQCECGKIYTYRQGLHVHKKKCTEYNLSESQYTKFDSNIVKELITQNKELQKQLIKSNVVVNNNTNNFNISVFLNEHCKNAINFSDFIDNIQVSNEDLQNNAQLGFVGGISKIITDNLKQLTLHERPIHCTDAKRETMYIKDQNTWQKDKSLIQEKLNRAIQEVSRKSVVSLMKWKQSNPDYADMDSDFSNLCLTMQQQSIAGMNREKFYPKVIHRIAESVPCKP